MGYKKEKAEMLVRGNREAIRKEIKFSLHTLHFSELEHFLLAT